MPIPPPLLALTLADLALLDFCHILVKSKRAQVFFERGLMHKKTESQSTLENVGKAFFLSDLNLHKFSVGFIDKPECNCHASEESTIHYMLDTFLIFQG